MPEAFDVVVIGGGTAGLVTASGSARLGRRVALIERELLGGDCLWTGCVPTKALVATARLAHQMRQAQRYGLEPCEVRVSPQGVMDSMRETQRITGRHDDPAKFQRLGIDVITGSARLLSPTDVEVNGRILRARDIVIATGSRTSVPPIPGLVESGFLDHASFLRGNEFPRSVVILGGGYIGVEFAQILRRFGSEVTLVEMGPVIAPREDHEVISSLTALLTAEGINIRTGWKATAVVRREDGRAITIEDSFGNREELLAAEIFVASGRRGNIEDLGLEAVGVATERSYIKVDEYLRTTMPHIWACGDVHGALQFTHVAGYEAVKIVRNMLFPGKSAVSYEHIPWGLYTDPEVAHLGLTESEARERSGDKVRIYKVDMMDVDRAVVDRATDGFIKLVCDDRGNILGAHALCSSATTLIEEIVLARKKGMRVSDLAQVVSPYPSLSDGIGKASSMFFQELNTTWKGAVARKVAALSQ